MKKTISHALWAFTLASFTVSACNSNKDSAQKASNSNETTAAHTPTGGESGGPESSVVDSASDRDESLMPASEAPKRDMKGKAQYSMKPSAMPVMPPPPPSPQDIGQGSEDYKDYGKNPMVSTAEDHLSTFAVDVDTASYAIARRKLMSGQLPPESAVRVEEFVNYFKYDYQGPVANGNDAPFAVHMDMAPSPFAKERKLLRVGVQAKKLSLRERKNANLVFLVDVSGSMHSADKLELAKRALRILVDNLKDGDTVSLVTYAGSTRVVLPPTGLEKKGEIISALEDLRAGGSTAMASGMELAYGLAAQTLGPNSLSRVIVLSDGDANIGNTSHDAMLKSIAGKVKEGVTLSTIGFGMGNYKDTLMEQLANKGNGNYFYIDGMNQARRVFQEQLGGTLEVVAKDVKIQVDFDPDVVKRYRLVGYENRNVADKDFRNDKVDAGEIGAGHTVTAMYEVELIREDAVPVTVRLRAKTPKGSKAAETAYAFSPKQNFASFSAAPEDFQFASAVMGAAEILRGSEHAAEWSLADVIRIAKASGDAHESERSEFISLMEKARELRSKLARR
jgi:Ca-activated chloride channel family protein